MDSGPGNSGAQTHRRSQYRRFAQYTAIIGIPLLVLVALVRRWPPTTPPSWTDVILVLATTAYVVVTCFQWHALRSTLALDNRTRRAWLVPVAWLETQRPEFRPKANGNTPTEIAFRNIGHVPTVKAVITAIAFLEQANQPKRVTLPKITSSGRGVVGPGQSHQYLLFISAGSHEQITAIEEGALSLKVEVEMRYLDTIGTRGYTAVTMEYQPAGPSGWFLLSGVLSSDRDMR